MKLKSNYKQNCQDECTAETQVRSILHRAGFYPYHIQKCHTFYRHITPTVYDYVIGCNHAMNSNILFTGEAQLTRDGTANTTNSHSWAQGNSKQATKYHVQQRFSFNMWCGVIGKDLTGPRFIEERLTAPHDRNFLENELPMFSEVVPLPIP
jgi:hypothetical protein